MGGRDGKSLCGVMLRAPTLLIIRQTDFSDNWRTPLNLPKCISIAVFCAIKQMVWTRFPWWWSRDPDTLNTWFPNMECFKGPPYPPLPSGWSRRLCTDPYAASFPPPLPPSAANSSNTVPGFPPLSPHPHVHRHQERGRKKGDSIISSSRLSSEHLFSNNTIIELLIW